MLHLLHLRVVVIRLFLNQEATKRGYNILKEAYLPPLLATWPTTAIPPNPRDQASGNEWLPPNAPVLYRHSQRDQRLCDSLLKSCHKRVHSDSIFPLLFLLRRVYLKINSPHVSRRGRCGLKYKTSSQIHSS
jgi:hypothetical protein